MDGSGSSNQGGKRTVFSRVWLQPNDARQSGGEDGQLEQTMRLERESAMRGDGNAKNGDVLGTEARGSNPFVAFKNFVDGQVAAIMHLPSNVADIKQRAHDEAAKQRECEREMQRRWTGGGEAQDNERRKWSDLPRQTQVDAMDALELLLKTSEARNRTVASEKEAALYADPEHEDTADGVTGPFLSVGGACYYMPESGDNLPSSASLLERDRTGIPRWLSVDWFKRSPYSPVSLEAHPQLGRYDTKWRHAFEDLLEASLDKPMSSEERFGQRLLSWPLRDSKGSSAIQSTWRGPGLDWMLSLSCRGILPPQLPSWYHPRNHSNQASIAAQVERDLLELAQELATPAPLPKAPQPFSELDMYEQQHSVVCPDEVGRAIGEAMRQECETGMSGCIDELGRAVAEAARHERESDGDRCPDELGRAVGEVTRQQQDLGPGRRSDELSPTRGNAANSESAIAPASSPSGSEDYLPEEYIDEDEFEEDEGEDEDEDDDYPGELWSRERQMHTQQKCEAVEYHKQDALQSHRPSASDNRPRVLSAFTTTHTMRLPDGTVTTKVMLKQRFADGREESSESVHTSYANAQAPADAEAEGSQNKQNKKGWFWS